MAKPTTGHLKRPPFSLEGMGNLFGGADPRRLAQMVELMRYDYSVQHFDFQEDTINAQWTTAVTAGGAPTAFAASAARGGQISGATGTSDNGVTAIHYDHSIWDAADNPLMIIRFKAPANVNDLALEIGFSDAKTSEAVFGVEDVDTPAIASGTTELVAIHRDTDQNTATACTLVGVGTNSNVTAATITGNGTNYSPTNSAWITAMVGVRNYEGFCSIWDSGTLYTARVAAGPETGTLVRPYAQFMVRAASASKTIAIDYITIICERNLT